ncbi:putative cilia- and flagella-associated protein 61 [Apostichopus japonicus]|uniref:Putative cilia-and flagella-associated protein 61 n=1 Tax=Stichopus japonicus TaxID=307972 RepID=A0A2G8K5U2_STIJA|nr:putative cilia- and flagella-associated protein 61 [Apostichopus japonicus]
MGGLAFIQLSNRNQMHTTEFSIFALFCGQESIFSWKRKGDHKTEPEPALDDVFTPLDSSSDAKHTVYVCNRHEHSPVLFVRKARVEDHDDLTPIFNRQSDMLNNTYGGFFLAELIESQDENNHCIIVEMDGSAVGFMSLSEDVDLDLLNSCFELNPFHEPVVEEEDKASEKKLSRTSSQVSGGDTVAEGEATQSQTGGHVEESGDSSAPVVEVQHKLSEVHMHSSASVASADQEEEMDEQMSVASGQSHVSSSASKRVVSEYQEPTPLQSPPATTPVLPQFQPEYKGELNAFSIQLFCVDERFEMRSMDFLPKAFSLYPDKDFCILTVPHLVPEFPLLQSFVRVTPKCPSILPQELYLFSKAGLLESFTVRPACSSDKEEILKVVENIQNKELLIKDLETYLQAKRDPDGTPIQALVATCLNQIVGISITRQEEDIEYVRSHYNVEDFIYFNHHRRDQHGHLHHFALNPVFQHWSKHFLKEILRQAHYTCLYYPVYPGNTEQMLETQSLVTCLNFMVPIRARRQIAYPLDQLGQNAPSHRITIKQEPYALCHINRKLSLEPKVTVNARVVVVGASDVAISFLNTLVFCPHLRFNNLVLISPHGSPGEYISSFLSSQECFTHEEMAQISLRTWVNVVNAKMMAINRSSKYVKITGGKKVPYDHLILCTGKQYFIGAPSGVDISNTSSAPTIPGVSSKRLMGIVPSNVFTINDHYDAVLLTKWMDLNFKDTAGKAIVYGSTIDAYTAVQGLLDFGIPGNRLAMVQPPLETGITCFNNPTVEEACHAAMKAAGVEVYQGYQLAQWNDGKDTSEVYCASFTSSTKPLKLECSLFICLQKKAVDYETFKAINDSCLVYDGSLVIDANFHTNDLSIRGAGPLTKFKRKYHAEPWSHANFNSVEVGISLASTMLRLFDPTIENDVDPPDEPLNLIPLMSIVLPGGYHYFHFTKPNLPVPLEAQTAQLDYGRQLVTGSADGPDPDYFRIHVNQYSSIETLTCLSKKPFEKSNYKCLYNIHERFLNNMISRFDEGLIKSFYEFFKENWCLAIFHDRFQDFRQEVRELLIERPSADVASLEEKIQELISQDLELEQRDRKYLLDEFTKTGTKRSVETRLLSFLSYNYYHLPMYAKPGMV